VGANETHTSSRKTLSLHSPQIFGVRTGKIKVNALIVVLSRPFISYDLTALLVNADNSVWPGGIHWVWRRQVIVHGGM
jgi:hypothetical protein